MAQGSHRREVELKFIDETQKRKNIRHSHRPHAIGYMRLSGVDLDSSLRQVEFDLTIQETSEGDLNEHGNLN